MSAVVELKLSEQRNFVLWWDGQEKDKGGRPSKTDNRSVIGLSPGKNGLPDSETLHRWRVRLGWTQQEIGDALVWDKSQINRKLQNSESGETQHSDDSDAIALLLDKGLKPAAVAQVLEAETGQTEQAIEERILGKHGGDRKSKARDQGSDSTLKVRGETAAYLVARLERVPGFFAEVCEFASIRLSTLPQGARFRLGA